MKHTWEYLAVEFQVHTNHGIVELSGELTAKGQDGWELVGFHWLPAREPEENAHFACIFKRPEDQAWRTPQIAAR